MPALWLAAVGQNQYTAVFGACSDTYGFLLCIQTSVGWCAKHCITLESKMPALWLIAVGQNHKTAVSGVCSDTYGFLLCIQTSVGWCAKHFITLNSKMPALWLAAVGQNTKQQFLVSAVTPMGFCCAYIPQWVGVPSTASL